MTIRHISSKTNEFETAAHMCAARQIMRKRNSLSRRRPAERIPNSRRLVVQAAHVSLGRNVLDGRAGGWYGVLSVGFIFCRSAAAGLFVCKPAGRGGARDKRASTDLPSSAAHLRFAWMNWRASCGDVRLAARLPKSRRFVVQAAHVSLVRNVLDGRAGGSRNECYPSALASVGCLLAVCLCATRLVAGCAG